MSTISLEKPDSALFQFPPRHDPLALPPPIAGSTLSAPPFNISAELYNSLLDVRVPITIAAVYAVSVSSLNAYNRSRGNEPWAISKTRAFFCFVVLHNIFLAVYSGWTFIGMWNALQNSLAGWSGPDGLSATVDSLCKIHGPRGLGNAVVYEPASSSWISQSPDSVFLTSAGLPDATDYGRLWNQGLAFYGWFFYLSKFYEVLDTVIILAKGKRSSTLQTYHHAGAMMCMWAGIRYMSPPIWMFVFVNSGIHALMYTYYTVTAFSVPIPQALKRSLTTMQIVQFLVGATYAAIHSFVYYTIPVKVPVVKAAAEKITSVASAAISSESATASVAASTTALVDLVKKYLFYAVGEQGLAENINAPVTTPSPKVAPITGNDGIKYNVEYQSVPCIATSGQTFAIWFNVLYLTPLTVLFVRFFVKSYLRRSQKRKVVANGKPVGNEKAVANGNTYAKVVENGSPAKANGKH
ncbi:hypothetical protein HYALB_00011298 [Hymenoscyphus albidus]|uniref:Elongation of fatty acids protein n=1 Tax=Hymenoscyphus albidus TaxID=595503 RepID=A0A9N9LKR1_9HELO|nr:hypothetical protein HYALB_00011298 [Hymenoscyphus albidus]